MMKWEALVVHGREGCAVSILCLVVRSCQRTNTVFANVVFSYRIMVGVAPSRHNASINHCH